jgi:hypothetical protein
MQVNSKVSLVCSSRSFSYSRVVDWLLAGEAGVQLFREDFRVLERVGDPPAGKRVLVIAGVAYERPSGASGTAIVVIRVSHGPESFGPRAEVPQFGGEVRP